MSVFVMAGGVRLLRLTVEVVVDGVALGVAVSHCTMYRSEQTVNERIRGYIGAIDG